MTRPLPVKVTFLGSGDAFGSGGRFQTCFLLDSGGRRALVDCGASSLVAMKKGGIDPATIEAIVISHLHGDHFGGVPFFFSSWRPRAGSWKRSPRPSSS